MPKDRVNEMNIKYSDVSDIFTQKDFEKYKYFLSPAKIEDYRFKKEFYNFREKGLTSAEAFEELHERHSHLQYETITKIVYRKTFPKSLFEGK